MVETLLDEILTPDRLASVAECAVELAKAEQDAPDLREQVERQLSETQTALGRLTPRRRGDPDSLPPQGLSAAEDLPLAP